MMARHFDENETMNLCTFLKKLSATSWLRATDSLRGGLPIMIEQFQSQEATKGRKMDHFTGQAL